MGDAEDAQDEVGSEEVVEWPIDGTLDLHLFEPRDVKVLVPAYLDECLKRGILQVRIVHGKGKGVLRRIVHAALDRHPNVVAYRHEGGSGGGWGATVVTLEEG
jgi:dsDNA-specific endonuclease/ATPase MutS2